MTDLPPIQKLWTLLLAGSLATISFDLFGQALAPIFGFAKLAPVGLATATLKTVFGDIPKGSGDLLHIFTGMFAYTLGYILIARPIQQKLMPNLPWPVTAIVYGIALWVLALYVIAHLVSGNKPFLGFTGITWVALWGHILYAVVAIFVIENSPFKTRQLAAA